MRLEYWVALFSRAGRLIGFQRRGYHADQQPWIGVSGPFNMNEVNGVDQEKSRGKK